MSSALSSRHLGVILAIIATLLFASQDAISKLLIADHSVWFILMVRYWFHLLMALIWSAVSPLGLLGTLRSKRPGMQIFRSILMMTEIALIVLAFGMLGLAEVTTIIMVHPLIVTALAALFLGETVGIRRVLALVVGMIGLLIIMQPSGDIWGPGALVALVATTIFAIYQLFTRLVSRDDPAMTSFLYAGLVGAVASTIMGLQSIPAADVINWPLLGAVCLTSTFSHFSLIKALSLIEASEVQPYTYLQIVWSIPLGYLVFDALPSWATIMGAALIVAAGLYSFSRTREKMTKKS